MSTTEEQSVEFAVAKEHIEFVGGHVNKEQYHQPNLNRQETRPGEVLNDIGRKIANRAAVDEEMAQTFGDPHNEYTKPIDHSFEQDRLNHRCTVEATHEGQVVGYQDSLSNDQRSECRGNKATKVDIILLQDELLGR
jgi:hypothetical protein